jgi:L-ascorbate metabolism protein UlaG (beta-lactamase superfamily)
LAILPIGDSDPRWFMSYGHMSPEECVRAFDDLGRPTVLPVHHSTFPLADTGYSRPLTDLQRAVAGHEEAQQRIVPLPIGHSRMIPR